MTNYASLQIRGKVLYHADVTILVGGVAMNLTGLTTPEIELKAVDDPDGLAISTISLALGDSGDPTDGTMEVDMTEAETIVLQDSGVTEGIFDAKAVLTGDTDPTLLFQGDWKLVKGVTD